MGERMTEGNANIRGGKLNLNDDCKTMLEVGRNKLSKSPKFSSVKNPKILFQFVSIPPYNQTFIQAIKL